MADLTQPLAGSHRDAPRDMRSIGRVPADEQIAVSLYIRPVDGAMEGATDRAALHAARSTEHADDIAAIEAFAKSHGLTVAECCPERRLIRLSGPASAVEQAFGTQLHHYEGHGQTCRGRHGALHVPTDLAGRITAVLGLDTRPIATPKIVPHKGPTPPAGFLPTDVARLYGVSGVDASGQCIGIIELGGGYTDADNQAAFKAMALAVPPIVAVGVDGASNDPSDTSGANGEVALDIQVAGGAAPGAKIAVYFAPNTDQGFVDAITQAVHDQDNGPSVLSISWGSAESGWTQQAIAAMGQAFKDAAQLGVTVCAASGDGLATDGVSDGKAHVDYPASDPFVLGCGGTKITASADAITGETVWNSNGGGTGGGVSTLFALPGYQDKAGVPPASDKSGGRGVPDVSGDADPDSGYRIITDGQTGIIGGTSAVAPLWAGIVAGLNAGRKAPLGQIHAQLYGDPSALRDIVSGNNKSGSIGFEAAKGWDACTGLGSPDGAKLKTLLS
ncbi:S53 family peptidase [Novosphingobium terrae]|uniref:S53 family peptidase n=1 Tax=Novosphingobium terrae TaxID=2726189 RepID=UPI00197CFCDD|nr:S53 family peptidase [Novosphingobium terrae]